MTVSHDCSEDEGSVNSDELEANLTNLFILRSSEEPDPADPLLLHPVLAAFFRLIRCIREANCVVCKVSE